jgi:signal transduction histidine kinase
MRSLYVRIYLTVLAALALFALVSGWIVQRHLDQVRDEYRMRVENGREERLVAWAELMQRALPGADEPAAVQGAALLEWSERLRVPMALDGADGRRIAASRPFERAAPGGDPVGPGDARAVRLDDGRVLWVARPPGPRVAMPPHAGAGGWMGSGHMAPPAGGRPALGWVPPRLLPEGATLVALLLLLFLAVAAGAYPVVRRLTRRLEGLQAGVEAFGAGALDRRGDETGRDEVARLAASFNRAAARIEALLRSHQSLLANASHELRSPLARLKMAVAMLDDAPAGQRQRLQREVAENIAELDQLVDEVLLASRLDAGAGALTRTEPVELLALAAEEGARVQAGVQGEESTVAGDERLLRRALRNQLENARRYGGGAVEVEVVRRGGRAEVRVMDRGPGVPDAERERIFEPFYRLPGHAEREGGVGLGLALVRQIATRHGGSVRCEPREGGGSVFTLELPVQPGAAGT